MPQKKTNDKIIGSIYSINGDQFNVVEIKDKTSFPFGKYKLGKMREKVNLANNNLLQTQRNIKILSVGESMDPYQILKVSLDLTKSSQETNEAFLYFLYTNININELLKKSILPVTLINYILQNPEWKDYSPIKNSIAKNQNIFEDYNILNMLSYMDIIALFTENKHRDKEKLEKNVELYKLALKTLLMSYDKEILQENPSELRNNIIKTDTAFYNGDIVCYKVKTEVLNEILENIKKMELEVKSLEIGESIINNKKVQDADWKNIKEILSTFFNKQLKLTKEKLENERQYRELVEKFPY